MAISLGVYPIFRHSHIVWLKLCEIGQGLQPDPPQGHRATPAHGADRLYLQLTHIDSHVFCKAWTNISFYLAVYTCIGSIASISKDDTGGKQRRMENSRASVHKTEFCGSCCWLRICLVEVPAADFQSTATPTSLQSCSFALQVDHHLLWSSTWLFRCQTSSVV